MGAGNAIRLFLVSLEGATDISSHESLAAIDLETRCGQRDQASSSSILNDLGCEFGQPGRHDFRSAARRWAAQPDSRLVTTISTYPIQVSQILAFAIGYRADAAFLRLQGARSHVSPLEGQWVGGIAGVVTALQGGKEAGFWLQDPEVSAASTSSNAIQVLTDHPGAVAVGDRVGVWGRVVEEDNRSARSFAR